MKLKSSAHAVSSLKTMQKQTSMIPRYTRHLMIGAVAALLSWHAPSAKAQSSGAMNFYGDYAAVSNTNAKDPNKPAEGRSYFLTSVEPLSDGAKLIVDIYHGDKNQPVSLYLQVGINDGKGTVHGIPIKQLSNNVSDNPTNYHSRREFILSYADLNAELQKVLPAGAKHMSIGPGSPLFVHGYWPNYGHVWGGTSRGGIFYMPEVPGTRADTKLTGNRRAMELDLAYPIPNLMALKYNDVIGGKESGLKTGGQIRSRLESEGKYQIPLADMERIKAQMYQLADRRSVAAQMLGPEWSVSAELRYMKKDANGQIILDKNGMPTPDPMIDTYYDSKDFQGAKKDMAIRYRWTEGNATGSWNFKPGLTSMTPDGVVNRLEFAVDTTDDKPQTIKKFADSMDPLNPLKLIRELVPGSTPSDFLIPSVRITDTRHKFKFTHTTGLVVEVSIDDVLSESLRGKREKIRYAQFEMDVDHPSTQSTNVARSSSALNAVLMPGMNSTLQSFLTTLGPDSFIDGRPVLHTNADLDPRSPVRSKLAGDFLIAEKMISNLRNHVLGPDWMPAPQKASLAAVLLGHVSTSQASASVKKLYSEMLRTGAGGVGTRRMFEVRELNACSALFMGK